MAVAPTLTAAPSAPRLVRMGAFFLDFVILVFAQRLGAYLGGIIAAVIMTARGAPDLILEQEIERGISFGASFWALSFIVVNYGVLQGIWGGSAGKLLCGLRVLNGDGSRIGVIKSLFRTGMYFFSAMPMYAGFVMAIWDRQARALHDHLCGTVVAQQDDFSRAAASPPPMPIPLQPLVPWGAAASLTVAESDPDYSRKAA